MSFNAYAIRQGARLATTLPRVAKCPAIPARAFHTTPKQQFFNSRAPRITTTIATRNAFSRVGSGARTFTQEAAAPAQQQTQNPLRRLLVAGGIFAGSLFAVNLVFNRDGREGTIPPYERSYLNETFLHTGLGIGIIGMSARAMLQSGFVYRLMATNPWVVGIGGLALSFATMYGTRSISPDNYIPKYALWTAFNATQAAMIAPLMLFVPGAILARAGLYTVAMMGGISVVGATAKQDKYLYLGGPLMAGACVILASGLAPLVIPATAVRALAISEGIFLYGGLAVFGGFTLWHVQAIMQHARLAERGLVQRDPVNESISLELDFINIFIRMVQILGMQGNRRK